MDIHKQFTSNQNKGMIWKLLCDNGTFNSIPESKANLVKIDFDRKIALIDLDMKETDQLVTLNKRVIGEMVQSVSKYQNLATDNIILPTYNAADISQQRQKVFENELKEKQNDFEKFNSKPVPNKIDFADKLDTPLGSEMDKILAEQIALREKQLNMVLETQDKTVASKWLQNGQSMPTNDNIQLKIGEDIKLEDAISPRKKVNFVDQEPAKDNFMSLLKKKPVSSTSVSDIPVPSTSAPSTSVPSTFVPSTFVPSTFVPSIIIPPDNTIKDMLHDILNKQNQILDILTNKYI
jgi:hypothetical protein